MSRREEILKKHKWAISQGKDGFWRTYLPDETKPSKRKLVKRKSKIDIEYLVIDYIEGRDYLNKKKEILFKDLYKEWIESKGRNIRIQRLILNGLLLTGLSIIYH